ncbi:MAG: hypothetical protein D6796_08580 [Caldilineae bacterium]|nr:MAG: hypothetical protein D6796_08580 [Caldilineae bacterium]
MKKDGKSLFDFRRWRNRDTCLAFALSGGGARGMLQVGALRALLEAGITPDLWVGTSAGAINATYLSVHGFTAEGLSSLEATWFEVAEADMLPASYLWLTMRVLLNWAGVRPHYERVRDFFVAHGVSPDLRFGDLPGPRLILVATDLNHRRPILYGEDPDQRVLEGLLASTAIPPWISPLQVGDRLLIDGGALSNLPIEPALRCGATEIIALNTFSPQPAESDGSGLAPFLSKFLDSVEERQIQLEMALAEAKGVPVHHIVLQPDRPVPLWDFSQMELLRNRGYEIARRELALWQTRRRPWYSRLASWRRRRSKETAPADLPQTEPVETP